MTSTVGVEAFMRRGGALLLYSGCVGCVMYGEEAEVLLIVSSSPATKPTGWMGGGCDSGCVGIVACGLLRERACGCGPEPMDLYPDCVFCLFTGDSAMLSRSMSPATRSAGDK